ncbi:50S ribosomal protein L29 [Candidatus Woesearchaeota archaeon]|nr:50S ribosomal protein L29 [Candidatus Woesearchaeota archaeon]
MKKKEIATLGKEESRAKLTELRKELMKSNAQVATGTVPKSPGQIRQVKKTIARILTNLSRKEETKKG